ncbi:unnamed protein product [Thlaspi arvense]|uniref:Leucine-rich repeat-containing N-terminal plant-type domain-containing protein n=1 Tax=Thlaspi arvense TaxID=13288 RepID=A0AAU9RIR0_THLAR|nr:unnamed protein product [Thlaspi arvense]
MASTLKSHKFQKMGLITVLNTLKEKWKNLPSNWVGSDPCGSGWDGINCTGSRVTSVGLSSNSFTEPIPHSIGNLSKLTRLDLNDNKLTGSIPISSGTLPGLDMLVNTLHFCIDNNQLTGNIPPSLGYVQTLEVVRLDSNLLNGTVPQNINNLTNLKHLHLSNNKLNGPVPSLTGMKFLSLTGMKFLSYVLMECTQVQGEIPVELFSSPHLETLILSYNQLSGTLDTGMSQSNQLRLIDLQNNSIEHLKGTTRDNTTLILVNNPICKGMEANERSCGVKNINFSFPNASNNCRFVVCRPDKTLSRNCSCTVPYTGTLYFLSIEEFLMDHFQKEKLPVDSVSVNSPHTSFMICRQLTVQVFPSGRDSFNRTEIAAIGNLLNRQNADLLKDFYFGPFYYVDESYPPFGVLTVGVYAFRQKKRAEQARAQLNPFASWDPQRTGDSIPSLQGARWFSFMELKKCTMNFQKQTALEVGAMARNATCWTQIRK